MFRLLMVCNFLFSKKVELKRVKYVGVYIFYIKSKKC